MDNGNQMPYQNAGFNYQNGSKKSGNSGLLIVLIVLLSVLICLFTYYLFFFDSSSNMTNNKDQGKDNVVDQGNNNNNNNNNQTQNPGNNQGNTDKPGVQTVDLSLEDPTVSRLSKIFFGKYTSGFSNYDDYFYKKDKTILAEEPDMLKTLVAFRAIDGHQSFGSSFGADIVKNSYENIFGKGTFAYTKIDYCPFYEYQAATNQYVMPFPPGCGGISCGGTHSKLAYAKRITSSTTDQIDIYEYFYQEDASDVCTNGATGTLKIYSDYKKTNLIYSVKGQVSESQVFTDYKDQLGLYKYSFVKDSSGNYIFTSVERVK